MPPPFKLETYKPPNERINKRLFYHKKEYQPKVKVKDWQHKRFDLPDRNNDFCAVPTAANSQTEQKEKECVCDRYKTVTKMMLDQRYSEMDRYTPPQNINKKFYNYYCFKDAREKDTKTTTTEKVFQRSRYWCPDYTTSMQMSYQPPIPYIMEPLKVPQMPFMKYRKMKGPLHIENLDKFLDDNIPKTIERLQANKMGHTAISYNFNTGFNNDGTIPKFSE